jgi:hypothetical protein
MVRCPRCGHENEPAARNCSNCRINLAWALENWDAEAAAQAQTARTEPEYDETRHHIWTGCAWFFVANLLLGFALVVLNSILFRSTRGEALQTINSILTAVPLLVNLVVLTYFAFTRPRFALGWLVAIGILLALVVIASLVFLAICFLSF